MRGGGGGRVHDQDLASLIGRQQPFLSTQDFLAKIDGNLQSAMGIAKAA